MSPLETSISAGHSGRSLEASYAFCQKLSRAEAKNFYWSFRLLDADRRRAMCAIYAFMRHTDDIADESGEPAEERARRLDEWQAELDAGLAGAQEATGDDWPGLAAIAETVDKYQIPVKYLHAVIDGMKWDLGPVRIQTEAEFEEYCWHVASVVGLCCLHIWGFDACGGRAETLASRLGLAFQRTNILRDIGEDYARNRVYLPASLMLKYGVRLGELGLPSACDSLKKLVLDQVAVAQGEYESAGELLGLVDPAGRPMLRAISKIYRGVLDQVEKQGGDVLARRARVSTPRKIFIMCRSVLG
ncbi:MAG: phytoene/squalene synthase family protein [Planctomycetota bacterium]